MALSLSSSDASALAKSATYGARFTVYTKLHIPTPPLPQHNKQQLYTTHQTFVVVVLWHVVYFSDYNQIQ